MTADLAIAVLGLICLALIAERWSGRKDVAPRLRLVAPPKETAPDSGTPQQQGGQP